MPQSLTENPSRHRFGNRRQRPDENFQPFEHIEHIELIEKFISNEMSSEELRHFENLIVQKIISEEAVEEYKVLKSKLISYGKIKSIRHKLNQYHSDIEKDRNFVLNSKKTIGKKEVGGQSFEEFAEGTGQGRRF